MSEPKPPPADPTGPHWIVMRMSPGPKQVGHPYFRHATQDAASREAQRLARANPGERFAVYGFRDA